jgi:ribokinase
VLALAGRVVVVGSVNVDHVIRLRRLPRPGETVGDGVLTQHMGGKGANQAVAARQIVDDVRLLAAVGSDDAGRAARDDLASVGVDVSGVRILPNTATGTALIFVDDAGANMIGVAPGANAALAPPDGRQLDHGHGVLLLGFEVPDQVFLPLAAQAAERGWVVVVNPAPARPLHEGLLATKPILVPNELELMALSQASDVKSAATALSERSGAPVVATLGERGALVADARSGCQVIAAPKVSVVDTTGAGDTFCGALAAALALGRELHDGVRIAVSAASRSIQLNGARRTPTEPAQRGAAV